jgi:hypothetical protein
MNDDDEMLEEILEEMFRPMKEGWEAQMMPRAILVEDTGRDYKLKLQHSESQVKKPRLKLVEKPVNARRNIGLHYRRYISPDDE